MAEFGQFFLFNMKCRCYTAADKWVYYLEEYIAGLYRIFYMACFYNISNYFFFFFSLSFIQYNQSGSSLGFLQTFDRFYTTRILRQVCGCVNLSLLMTFSVFALLEAFMPSLSDGYCRQSEVCLIRACRNEISSDSQVLSWSGWFSFRPRFIGSVLN